MNNDDLKLKTDRKLPFKTILSRNLKYVKPELPSFITALILLLINVGLGLTMPLFMGDITNELNGEVIDTALTSFNERFEVQEYELEEVEG
jgi:hypothetical protein